MNRKSKRFCGSERCGEVFLHEGRTLLFDPDEVTYSPDSDPEIISYVVYEKQRDSYVLLGILKGSE